MDKLSKNTAFKPSEYDLRIAALAEPLIHDGCREGGKCALAASVDSGVATSCILAREVLSGIEYRLNDYWPGPE